MTASKVAVGHNPLADWAARSIGIPAEDLTFETIRRHQLVSIRRTVAWARQNSSFYAGQLAEFPIDWPLSLEDFASAPLTSPDHISERGSAFLCVPQSEISRIVTLETSGTTGDRKRIFFTAADQELALDFFAHGIASIASQGDRMLIALPCEREGSVGYQLARGISRAGVVPIPHGLILDTASTLARMEEEQATVVIGLPVQVLALACDRSETARRVFRRMHTIVLCSDHVPRSLVSRIRHETGCAVFEHYGSTEMGLGGGLQCHAHSGYHLREADLYFEILCPETGNPLPDGETGEVVFTTLGRFGMPLIRYRTGDLGRIKPSACSCGLPLRRLARIENRMDSLVSLGSAGHIAISELDEALFAIPQLLDFSAAFVMGDTNQLEVCAYALWSREELAMQVRDALASVPSIAANCFSGALQVVVTIQDKPFSVTGAKRRIRVMRPGTAPAHNIDQAQEAPSLR